MTVNTVARSTPRAGRIRSNAVAHVDEPIYDVAHLSHIEYGIPIGQTFFVYVYEPGANRVELCAGGYQIVAPDWQPVRWTEAERARGQAWGASTVASFHTYGTPVLDELRSVQEGR